MVVGPFTSLRLLPHLWGKSTVQPASFPSAPPLFPLPRLLALAPPPCPQPRLLSLDPASLPSAPPLFPLLHRSPSWIRRPLPGSQTAGTTGQHMGGCTSFCFPKLISLMGRSLVPCPNVHFLESLPNSPQTQKGFLTAFSFFFNLVMKVIDIHRHVGKWN